ncbi:MAG TPA: hypothetical protein VJ873_08605, partial [bacterium]|nr:hypothetical protein [bacterium]
MVAVSLWSVAALFGQKFEKVPLWIGLGALFLGLRAFFSPSALGAVWFLEIAGILLAFYLVLPCFEKPERFLRIFLLMGLAWAVKVWWASFYYAEPGLGPWLHFQYSDVKDWVIFPNPKQVGIFLIPLVLLFWRKPWTASENPFQNTKRQIFFTAEAQRRREKNVYFSRFWDICLNFAPLRLCGKRGFVTASMFFAAAAGLLTMIRLKASSSFAGLGAGLFHRVWLKSRVWAVALVLVLGAVLFAYRFGDSSSTSKDRLHIWMDSGKVWLESPWIGVGPGAFAGLYHQVKT